jgi:hypothetical protein
MAGDILQLKAMVASSLEKDHLDSTQQWVEILSEEIFLFHAFAISLRVCQSD